MTKKQSAIKWTISIFLVAALIAINAYIHVVNERYINTQGSHLTLAYEEIERLGLELAEEKELRQKSNWELQMIDAKDEGVKYQKSDVK